MARPRLTLIELTLMVGSLAVFPLAGPAAGAAAVAGSTGLALAIRRGRTPKQRSPFEDLDVSRDPLLGRRFGSYRLLERLERDRYRALPEATLDEQQAVEVLVFPNVLPEALFHQLLPFRDLQHGVFPELLDYGTQDGTTFAVFPSRKDEELFARDRTAAELVKIFAYLMEGLHRSWQHGLDPGPLAGYQVRVRDCVPRLDFCWRPPYDGRCQHFELPTAVAPERMNGTTGPTASQFELGLLLYLGLTARPAFGEFDPMQQTIRSLTEPPGALELDNAELEAVVLKLLERDPAARYPDLLVAAAALRAANP